MIECVKRALRTGRKVNIIYVSRSRLVSKRMIQILSYTDEHIIAFCYMRNQMRTFKLDRILAIEQSEWKMEVQTG